MSSSIRSRVGEIEFTVKDIEKMSLEEYLTQLEEAISKEQKRINSIVDLEQIKNVAKERWDFLTMLIANDNTEWKKVIPGRVVCHKFASLTGVDKGRFKNMYINQSREEGYEPFREIIDIFESFKTFSL